VICDPKWGLGQTISEALAPIDFTPTKTKPPTSRERDQGLERDNLNTAQRSIEVEHLSKLHSSTNDYDAVVTTLFGGVHFAPAEYTAARGDQLKKIPAIVCFFAHKSAVIDTKPHHACDALNGIDFVGKSATRKHNFASGGLQVNVDFTVVASEHFKLWFTHCNLFLVVEIPYSYTLIYV
jgi:hypothetical protein